MNRSLATSPDRPAMTYPYLDRAALSVINLLETPVLIISFLGFRICWSNAKATSSLGLTPFENGRPPFATEMVISDDSDRIARYRAAFESGKIIEDCLPLGPNKALMTLCRAQGISLIGHPRAMLIEVDCAIEAQRISHKRDVMAHDLRTPLALIDSSAQILEQKSSAISATELRNKAQRIRRSVQRMLRLLEDATGRAMPLTASYTFDVSSLLQEIAENFREHPSRPDIALDLPFHAWLTGSPDLLERLFTNLLENSVKFAVGRPSIRITGTVDLATITIDLRDRGIGIPDHERRTIFLNYVRGSNAENFPGTGLGLGLARQIAELHRGMIELIDTDGPGAAFRVVLPFHSTPH